MYAAILAALSDARKHVRDRLCRAICGGDAFDYAMSLEIDRLLVENAELRERLERCRRGWPHD